MPEIYTIPSGVPIKFEVKNVNGVGSFNGETNFRLADSRVSGSFHTGRFGAANPDFNTVVETTLDIPEKIGCLFLYSSMTVGMQIEFDVELIVNGERWI